MKRDGRSLAHNTLEEMRILAVRRMAEGEQPDDVAASFGMHRSWAYKIRAQARGRGRGLRVLLSTKGTGRPRKLTHAQERQVLRCEAPRVFRRLHFLRKWSYGKHQEEVPKGLAGSS